MCATADVRRLPSPPLQVAVGVMSAFAAVWAIFRTWAWSSRNGKTEVDSITLVRAGPGAVLPRSAGTVCLLNLIQRLCKMVRTGRGAYILINLKPQS